jgi:acetyltransferase-like isoleucine patch superfamily enzyme
MPPISASATVEPTATVADSATVWDLSQIRAGAEVGEDCVIGRNVFIDAGVVVGRGSKVQNNALLYAPARVGDGVFIGPAVVLTNDRHPRAVDPEGRPLRAGEWSAAGVSVQEGASLGAGVIVVGGVTVGPWAMCAAGAVVTADVPAFALVAGVPAQRIGWVSRLGHRLEDEGGGAWRCPSSGQRFREVGDGVEEVP